MNFTVLIKLRVSDKTETVLQNNLMINLEKSVL
jgi:hypothetical protein